MLRILSGIETEYGLFIDGRGAEEQVDDATAFVRSYPGPHFAGWDYRYESPRADLRGFAVSRLQFDPVDAKYDSGKVRGKDEDVRSDRVLPNGARFYNDHGHPEYSTPECWSLNELALHDKAGELVLLQTAKAFAASSGHTVGVYKNNTDYHGASYGTHENYLVPRAIGFERLYRAVMPMLVARQILTGAGKVGAESGKSCIYQISQRADFFAEPFNTETLYRRPIFNTRDEPHADHRDWIRMHVISGDANMIASCSSRKVGLVRLAILLELTEEAPILRLQRPVAAFQDISRDDTYEFKVDLEGGSWTTAYEILESYFAAGEKVLGLRAGLEGDEAELYELISECRELLQDLRECPERFAKKVDWAAKKSMLEHFMEEEGTDWSDPSLHSFDLEYHNIDPEEGLFFALQQMGTVEPDPPQSVLLDRLAGNFEGTRALARGLGVSKFKDSLAGASWRSIVFREETGLTELLLDPDRDYPAQLADAENVGTFIKWIQELNSSEATTG
jgi:proteasome accessory factor A